MCITEIKVGNTGVEPARIAPLVPKTNVSANFTNSPGAYLYYQKKRKKETGIPFLNIQNSYSMVILDATIPSHAIHHCPRNQPRQECSYNQTAGASAPHRPALVLPRHLCRSTE